MNEVVIRLDDLTVEWLQGRAAGRGLDVPPYVEEDGLVFVDTTGSPFGASPTDAEGAPSSSLRRRLLRG